MQVRPAAICRTGPNQDQPLRPVTCRDQTPPQPRILQPSLACCRRPKMGRNGTEWYRIRKIRPFLPPAASSAHHRRCSHPGSSRTLLGHRTRCTPYRWLQDRRFRHELTRLRQEAQPTSPAMNSRGLCSAVWICQRVTRQPQFRGVRGEKSKITRRQNSWTLQNVLFPCHVNSAAARLC